MRKRMSPVMFCSLGVWLSCLSLTAATMAQTHSNTETIEAIHYSGRVVDRSTGEGINAALISLISSGQSAWRTDASGRFSFWSSEKGDRIKIERDGYRELFLIAHRGALQEIQLEPLFSAPSRAIQFTASERRTRLTPPSQAVAPAIATADSGRKPSGAGNNWSPWYRLGVGKAPSGYTVQKDEFWLSGDHTCGISAECREITRNDDEVLWEFRLRGHKERGAPRTTYSVGHIRVSYRVQ